MPEKLIKVGKQWKRVQEPPAVAPEPQPAPEPEKPKAKRPKTEKE